MAGSHKAYTHEGQDVLGKKAAHAWAQSTPSVGCPTRCVLQLRSQSVASHGCNAVGTTSGTGLLDRPAGADTLNDEDYHDIQLYVSLCWRAVQGAAYRLGLLRGLYKACAR